MNELGRESRALVAAARHGDRLPAADKSRIRSNIVGRLGAGVALGSAVTVSATAANAARLMMFSKLSAWFPAAAKLLSVVAVSTAVGVGTVHVIRPASSSAQSKANASSSVAGIAPAVADSAAFAMRLAAIGETAPATAQPATSRATAQPATSPATATSVTRTATSTARQPATVPTTIEPPSDERDVLARQMAVIREARAATRRGDAAAALAALDRAEAKGESGPLDQEVILARVSALCLQGNVTAARQLANAFVARFPGSLLAARIRTSCAFDANAAR